MIRNIFLSFLFFFGPAMLMFLLRYLGLFLRLWFMARKMRGQQEPEVIDITPKKPHPPSTAFIIFTFVISLIIAVLVWQRLGGDAEVGKNYVPARVSEQGRVVPGHYE
ncbi:MAG: hypothetical protein ACE5DY_02115 [Mariprofundaceae bacterium]